MKNQTRDKSIHEVCKLTHTDLEFSIANIPNRFIVFPSVEYFAIQQHIIRCFIFYT